MVRGIERGAVFKDNTDRNNFQQSLICIRVAWATRPSRNYSVALTLARDVGRTSLLHILLETQTIL
jgi:hypothetical protein